MLISLLSVAIVAWLLASWFLKLSVSKSRESGVLAGLVAFLDFGMALTSIPAALTGALVFCMGKICQKRGVTGWRFAATTFAMVPLSVTILSLFAWQHVRKLNDLQAKYPFVPIADRLGYEAAAVNSIQLAEPDRPVPILDFDTNLLTTLLDQQADMSTDWRHRLLGELHQSQLEAFINSPGFGPLRGLPSVSEAYLKRDPRPTITPPNPPEIPYMPEDANPSAVAAQGELAQKPTGLGANEQLNDHPSAAAKMHQSLKSLHNGSAIDFINPQGFGYVKSGKVTGFDPHAFSRIPALEARFAQDWSLVSLQLVSMLKHKTPVVYATKDLPSMEVLRSEDIPTRPLDTFEATALPKIKQGEMIVVEQSMNRIRMLGAVRAANSCIECHSVPRNTLLGAFSYELARLTPLPETKSVIHKPQL